MDCFASIDARNDNFNYIHAFSYALKNQFEIISRNENYAFNHNKNFCRNGNNLICLSFAKSVLWERGDSRSNPICMDYHAYARNDKFVICDDKSKDDYFLAMIMARILFLVFGIILISAFYLIEKLIQKKFYFRRRKNDEKDFFNEFKRNHMGSGAS